ncbi:hypothetical protein EF903_01665 [Streptomyces sp. WAC05292]|uniref:hypothetical protein n=1 Tax=Streptomyces sp. WAC05292 TaxID=2487418 RepID=UPI000F747C5E|nr:hypothetical protein [Streptomyces sp. WAC05292]RSS97254.1 hypothetical protein EF903_01665 [Streptomyces sp. WAC05292]
MTNTRKTSTPTTEAEIEATTAAEPVLGPPLRDGQAPEKVTFAHHLRIGGRDCLPGETALLSPDYARQLRGNGYLARGRG